MRRLGLLAIELSAIGALAALLCDPRSGRRRRALLCDRAIHMASIGSRASSDGIKALGSGISISTPMVALCGCGAPSSKTATARRIVEKAAGVSAVKAVVSLMWAADGTPVGGMAGGLRLIDARPRAALRAEDVRRALFARWPFLSDADILAAEGHLGTLSAAIAAHAGEAENAIRVELEEILLAAV